MRKDEAQWVTVILGFIALGILLGFPWGRVYQLSKEQPAITCELKSFSPMPKGSMGK